MTKQNVPDCVLYSVCQGVPLMSPPPPDKTLCLNPVMVFLQRIC